MSRAPFASSVTDFIQAIGLLVRRARGPGHAGGLSWIQAFVLKRLATDGPATAADLARAEGMKPQSMGAIVAALTEMGLIARKPHPTDGRQVMLEITAKGINVRQRTSDARQAWLSEAIARLPKEDQRTLFAAGAIIKRLAES